MIRAVAAAAAVTATTLCASGVAGGGSAEAGGSSSSWAIVEHDPGLQTIMSEVRKQIKVAAAVGRFGGHRHHGVGHDASGLADEEAAADDRNGASIKSKRARGRAGSSNLFAGRSTTMRRRRGCARPSRTNRGRPAEC